MIIIVHVGCDVLCNLLVDDAALLVPDRARVPRRSLQRHKHKHLKRVLSGSDFCVTSSVNILWGRCLCMVCMVLHARRTPAESRLPARCPTALPSGRLNPAQPRASWPAGNETMILNA